MLETSCLLAGRPDWAVGNVEVSTGMLLIPTEPVIGSRIYSAVRTRQSVRSSVPAFEFYGRLPCGAYIRYVVLYERLPCVSLVLLPLPIRLAPLAVSLTNAVFTTNTSLSPWKRRYPASIIVYRVTPNDHTSAAFPSYAKPWSTFARKTIALDFLPNVE